MDKIFDIIKYEGDNTTFVWKHPCEDFNTGTQLIVHESQEAIFFMNGQALDSFGAGRHTLESQNIPLVGKFFNLSTNDKTPFHCEVYFINKTEQMAIKWGTDSKVEYMDPTYNFPIKIGASGEMILQCSDSRKLLVKIVGTECGITQTMLIQKFRAFLMLKIKTYLATLIRESKINIFSIDEYLTKMSDSLQSKLGKDFNEYGMNLVHFFVTTIVKPEEDSMYQTFKELHFRKYADIAEAQLKQQVGIIEQQTEAQRMVIESQGLAQKRSTEGYTYREERKFDVAQKVAENEATGEFANMGIGLGMISGIGSTVGGAVGGIMGDALDGTVSGATIGTNASNYICNKCGKNLPQGAKFCLECGQKIDQTEKNEIICPNCGAKTTKGKFCTECGHVLIDSCPKCGNFVPIGSNFCLQCGTKLSEENNDD
ncbi:MAG: SPFH domain-containing protein [Erysipelotrichaceae bacterium]